MLKMYGDSDRTSGLEMPHWKLNNGQTHFGAWCNTSDPLLVDTLAAEGFDWICIDGQHGRAEIAQVQPLIQAAHLFSVPAAVRIAGHDTASIGRCIDAGAAAIIVPTVDDAQVAQTLVASCRFPPRGRRSFGPMRLSPRYPKVTPGRIEDDPLCILMIETETGLKNLDEILATRPDGIFVGPYDLSLSLGVTLKSLMDEGQGGVLEDIANRCHQAGVTPGIYTGDLDSTKRMQSLGFRFMPVASDTGLLALGARSVIKAARS